MNERIKIIGRQAGFAFIEDGVYGDRWYSSKCGMDAEEFEKFAQLIVRECADIAKHHVMNISTYADADFVDEQIKEHFGVEE